MAIKKIDVKGLVKADTQTNHTISMKLRESKDLSGEGKIEAILLEKIIPNRYNPRQLPLNIKTVIEEFVSEFTPPILQNSKEKLDEIIQKHNESKNQEVFDQIFSLALHIAEHGMMSPILVTPVDNETFEVVAGERRYWASHLIGRKVIRAAIRHLDEKQHRVLSISENLARENLSLKEQVIALTKLQSLDEQYLKHLPVQYAFGINRRRAFALLKCAKEPYLSQVISGKLTNANNISETNDFIIPSLVNTDKQGIKKIAFKVDDDKLAKLARILNLEFSDNPKDIKASLQKFLDNL